MTDIGNTDFGVQISIGFVGKIITAVLGLIGSILVARIVGPSGYGIFYISMSLSQFVENPITGWSVACKKRMTESDFDTSETLGSVFLAIGGIILIIGPTSYLILNAVTQDSVIPIAVPLIFATTSSYWAINTFLSGRGNFSLSVWSGSINTLIQVIGKIILVVMGFGVWGMIGGTVVGPLFVLPILLRWIGVRPSIPSWRSIVSITEYARWSIPSGFVGTALSRMDTILLGWLVTASMAGKYQVGLKLTMPAVFISGVIGTGLMGRISNLDSREQEWSDDLWNSLSYGSLLSVPILFGSLVIGEELAVLVFGREYSGAGIFVVGLALYRLIDTQISPLQSVIKGLNRPDIVFKISLISFIINAVLGVYLWWLIDAPGIIVATVLASAMRYFLTVIYFRQITDVDFLLTTPFLKQVFSGIIMVAFVYAAKSTFGVSSQVKMVAYLIIGGITYFGLEITISHHLRATAFGIWKDFQNKYI